MQIIPVVRCAEKLSLLGIFHRMFAQFPHALTIFAPLFYTFLLGLAWPPRGSVGLAEFVLMMVAKSLFISWVVVAISYWLNLGDLLPWLIGLTIASLVIQVLRPARFKLVIDQGVGGLGGAIIVATTLAYMMVLLLSGYGTFFAPIFQTNDALASWNRWAIELSQNEYNPYNAAYPILLPGLWSLIYKAQGHTEVWFFAKATTVIFPVLLSLIVALLATFQLILPALFVAAVGYFFLFKSLLFYTFIGDMDVPVAVMILVTAIVSLAAMKRNVRGLVWLAALFAGVAVLVKQAGVAAYIPFIAVLIVMLRRRAISAREALQLVAVAFIPALLFASMFFASGQDAFGNLENLQRLTVAAAGGGSPLRAAANHLVGVLPEPLLYLIFGLAFANFLYLNRVEGIIGAVILGAAAVGFLQYAQCCSYDARNGWWVISLLISSAAFGLSCVEYDLPRYNARGLCVSGEKAAASMIIVVLGAFAMSLGLAKVLTPARLIETQLYYQWRLVPSDLVQLLEKNQHKLGAEGRIISEFNMARWLPGYEDRYVTCGVKDQRCIRSAMAEYPESMILTDTVANDVDAKRFVPELVAPHTLVGTALEFNLYQP